MKKFVLFISMIFCVSLFVGCANIFMEDTKTEDKKVPNSGEYIITDEKRDGQTVGHITSGGAQIDGLAVNFKGGALGGMTVYLADNGKFTYKNGSPFSGATWKYHDNALWIIRIDSGTTEYKYELV